MMERYSRQILFGPIGDGGQQLLAKKHVLVIGIGTLGTLSSEALARAGVGTITLADRDYVEWSNLQRQQLFTEQDAKDRIPKVIAASRQLKKVNTEIDIHAQIVDVTPEEMEELVQGVDLILDATDNFDIRMIINDAAQKYRVPWIYGSCVGSYGMSYTVLPKETPCLHCLMETIPVGGETCDTAGIIYPTASQVVVHQTAEALKILTHNQQALRGDLVSFDVWDNQVINMDVQILKKDDCASCSEQATYPFLQYEQQMKSAILCGREAVQIRPPYKQNRDLRATANRLSQLQGKVELNDFLLSFTIGKERLVLFTDGRALVHGTNDVDKAKTLYHRYFS